MTKKQPTDWQRMRQVVRAQWRDRSETDQVADGAVILVAGVVVISPLWWWLT